MKPRKSPRQSQCLGCRWFELIGDSDYMGHCRRYPPHGLEWAVVNRFNWCGEYKKKRLRR